MRYVTFLFIVSILFIIVGFVTGKISGDSLTYISITGSLLAILQILVIVLILMLGIAMTLPALLIDLLLLIFTGMYFPLVGATWNIVWDDVTLGWFWASTSGSSLLFASIVLAIISFLCCGEEEGGGSYLSNCSTLFVFSSWLRKMPRMKIHFI